MVCWVRLRKESISCPDQMYPSHLQQSNQESKAMVILRKYGEFFH